METDERRTAEVTAILHEAVVPAFGRRRSCVDWSHEPEARATAQVIALRLWNAWPAELAIATPGQRTQLHKGVSKVWKNNRWQWKAQVSYRDPKKRSGYNTKNLGYFQSACDAAMAHDRTWARMHPGDTSGLNFQEGRDV